MKALIGAVLALLVLSTPRLAVAQDETSSPTIQGTVVSSGNTSLVIAADDGTTRTFVIDTATTLPTGDLAAGRRVAVRYRALDPDRAQALSVSLQEAVADAAGAAPAGSSVPADEVRATGPQGPVRAAVFAGLGVAAALVFVWVFGRRRREEVPHLSL